VRVLVTAASKHEGTVEIAEAIARKLTELGVSAASRRPDEVESVADYDAVILGSGVYAGHWLSAATGFAARHRDALRERPVWLFSSGPIGSPDPKPPGDPEEVAQLISELQAHAHRVFAGRLDRRRLGFGERAIVSVVRAQDGDYRAWPLIEAWAREIAEVLAPQPVAV